MNAKEFLKDVSPNNKFGLRADLNKMRIRNHIEDIMERYAVHYWNIQTLNKS